MFHLFLIILSLGVMTATPAFAKNEPSQLTDDEDGLSYKQKASKILVAVETGKDITLTFTALPQIALCGTVTDLPVEVEYNNEEVNIKFKDYKFIHPVGQEKPDCGPANKSATAHVIIDRAHIDEYNIKNIRMFYNGWVESYRVHVEGDDIDPKAMITVTPPDKLKFFIKDERAEQAMKYAVVPPGTEAVPAPVTPAPAPQTPAPSAAEAVPSTNLVILTTGDAKKDTEFAADLTAIATARGLVATATPSIYSDAGGQFWFQLGFTPELPIGAIEKNGVHWPVVARRAP